MHSDLGQTAAQPRPLSACTTLRCAQGKVADSLMQRLVLKPAKIAQLAEGIRAIARQEEPIGHVLSKMEVAKGTLTALEALPLRAWAATGAV